MEEAKRNKGRYPSRSPRTLSPEGPNPTPETAHESCSDSHQVRWSICIPGVDGSLGLSDPEGSRASEAWGLRL